VPPAASNALPAQPPEGQQRYGEVFDRGYKHYDGPRLGRREATRALIGYSIKRAMGIKKSWTAKVIPILLYIAVFTPVIISIGIRAFVPTAEVLDYGDFFGFVFLIEGVFAATIAPELLCSDRHERVLPLYFARMITRLDYLLAKLAAAAILMLTMSLVPAAILWLGRQLLDDKPLTAISNNIDDLGRLIVGGVLVSVYIGSVALMISSFTGRKSIAVAIIILLFLVSTSLAFALSDAINNENTKYLVFLSPTNTVDDMSNALFNRDIGLSEFDDNPFLPLWQYIGGMVAITVASLGVMLWRYLPDE
jgi:ABC-2 type transport system permease protein